MILSQLIINNNDYLFKLHKTTCIATRTGDHLIIAVGDKKNRLALNLNKWYYLNQTDDAGGSDLTIEVGAVGGRVGCVHFMKKGLPSNMAKLLLPGYSC